MFCIGRYVLCMLRKRIIIILKDFAMLFFKELNSEIMYAVGLDHHSNLLFFSACTFGVFVLLLLVI
jgi:hypothetical protein